jgi:tRNA (cmo5U34)-methyltransferase
LAFLLPHAKASLVMNEHDEVFKNYDNGKDFTFDASVAAVFDNMLERSVPYYKDVITMIADLLRYYLKPNDLIVDLGCSTGTTLQALQSVYAGVELQMVGVDSSQEMISKANQKSIPNVRFICADMENLEIKNCGAIVLNYTLQFLRPIKRQEFLRKVLTYLRPGGVLILSEKTISSDSRLNRAFIEMYMNFKRRNGYSEMEIAKKREALENVLIPYTAAENTELLLESGFARAEQFFQYYNFSSFIALKSDEY